jgi:cytochrome P450
MKVGDVNLSDQSVFGRAVPHDYFRMLRRDAPMTWQPDAADIERGGFWSVVRHADITAVEKNVAVFSSRTNVSPQYVKPEHLAKSVDHVVILTDPPRHTFLRGGIMQAFTPKALAALELSIRNHVTDAIDAVIESGSCDFLDVAAYIPVEVVADMLGVPQADRPALFDWANAMFGSGDPEISSPEKAQQAGEQMFGYAVKLAAQRRAQPTDDVFSTIANLREDGELLGPLDLGGAFLIFATAGNETTRSQMLHGLKLLMEDPQSMAELRANPSLIPNAVEEMLRITSPALSFVRKATRDIEVGGQPVRAGDRVVMWYCSGSRDEAVFEDPDRFDIRRKNARDHLAFGARGGIHHCIGAQLARMELRILFEELLARMHDIEADGAATRMHSNFTNGLKTLPIRFTPAERVGARKVTLYASHRQAAVA